MTSGIPATIYLFFLGATIPLIRQFLPRRDRGPIPETYRHFTDPYIALARASAVTTKIKLATGITLVPERNPLILAKQISALDHYSGGRFLFGIGAGWNREETTMMGVDLVP